MKKVLIGLMFIVVNGSYGLSQTNFYTNVTNLWYQGHKTNVLAIANSRLSQNTNDIAGLILKAEYHLEFCEDAAISNAFLRIIQVGDTIIATNFVYCWQDMGARQNHLDILEFMAETPLTPQQIQEESLKGLINEKPLLSAFLIEALQKDGYFQ